MKTVLRWFLFASLVSLAFGLFGMTQAVSWQASSGAAFGMGAFMGLMFTGIVLCAVVWEDTEEKNKLEARLKTSQRSFASSVKASGSNDRRSPQTIQHQGRNYEVVNGSYDSGPQAIRDSYGNTVEIKANGYGSSGYHYYDGIYRRDVDIPDPNAGMWDE